MKGKTILKLLVLLLATVIYLDIISVIYEKNESAVQFSKKYTVMHDEKGYGTEEY